MLSDDVVREIDLLAHRAGTNRSNFINQVLAEYVNLTTPEKRANDIFKAIEEMTRPMGELIPFFAPNNLTMSLKSCLQYKYRPTLKYEVALMNGYGSSIGELSVVFRTRSEELISDMEQFFRIWKTAEDGFLSAAGLPPREYALYNNKLVRSIASPQKNCTSEELAEAIGGYIELFDSAIKEYLSGQCSAEDIAAAYKNFAEHSKILI